MSAPTPVSAPDTDERQAARALTWRYAVALVLVACLSSAAWLSLRWVIQEQESTAALVNVSGRQRMLSQRTALFSQRLARADAAERTALEANLAEALALMRRSHQGLTHGDASMGLPAQMSDAVHAQYFGPAGDLDARVERYLNTVAQWLQLPAPERSPSHALLAHITEQASGPLLAALDAMVTRYQQEGEARITRLQRAETSFWLLTLLLLSLEAALIFHPFVRHMHRVIGQLQATSAALRQHQEDLEALVSARTQALHDSEEKFRQISTSARDGIAIFNAQDRLVYANPAARALFNLPEGDALPNCPAAELLAPKSCAALAQGLLPLARAYEGQRHRIVAQRQRAQQFPAELSLAAVSLGGQWHTIAWVRDVTEQDRIETDLRIAATAFNTQMGMTIADANQTIVRVNPAFTAITGYAAEEVIGHTPHLLSSGRHDDAFYRAMYDAIAQTGMWAGEIWNRHKDGHVYPEWLTITGVRDRNNVLTHYVAAFSDISERKAAETQIRNLAFYDPLTDLPNRRLLLDRLALAMPNAHRDGHCGALLFIDLDNFKVINDTLGHPVGDQLLQAVAQRLTQSVRAGDTVARLGGDEFVVMLENLGPTVDVAAERADAVAHVMLKALATPYLLGANTCHSSASIGVAVFPSHDESVDDLLKRADLSMYEAKASGRNAVRFFDPAVQARVQARAELEAELRAGIASNALRLYYQPQVDVDGHIVGAEVLVRWQHPQRGLVGPSEFIALAEQSGLIVDLGQWVLAGACAQLAVWAHHPERSAWVLAVNVSAVQFRQRDFVDRVLATLKASGAPPQRLKLELTESLLIDNVQHVVGTMQRLKALGVGFSLDDFGTGYSSLAYLSQLPLDQIKIDQGFVHDIGQVDSAASICAATISLAHNLGLKVVAEGVETPVQRYFLCTVHHCDLLQGFLFARPMPLDDLQALTGRCLA